MTNENKNNNENQDKKLDKRVAITVGAVLFGAAAIGAAAYMTATDDFTPEQELVEPVYGPAPIVDESTEIDTEEPLDNFEPSEETMILYYGVVETSDIFNWK